MMRRRDSELDMTPMVDVTFLLLVFFMVTASFSLTRAVEMPAALSDQPTRQPVAESTPDPIRLQVDRYGTFLLLGIDRQRELVGKRSLVNELIAARAAAPAEVGLRIEVESAARLQALVDAVDAAATAGFHRYQLTEIQNEFI